MRIEIHYKTKDGKQYRYKKEMTIKEAKKLYNNELKNDNNIVEVFLTHFDG